VEKESGDVRLSVRRHYARAAASSNPGGCGCGSSGCCDQASGQSSSVKMGYSPADIEVLPEGVDLGLGCGNPGAIAAIKPGEVVLDLGSGAGMDCFLAAKKTGATGRVIGVDMTSEMIAKARINAARIGLGNVEFRLGEIERLPVEADSVDVIISNCVINLSPDKLAVWREAHRVLKPGGRVAIADVVARGPVPEGIRADVNLWSCCAAGAQSLNELRSTLAEAGFSRIDIRPREESRELIKEWSSNADVSDYFVSADIEAFK